MTIEKKNIIINFHLFKVQIPCTERLKMHLPKKNIKSKFAIYN